MRRYLAVGSTALLLVHCNAVTPVAPAPEEEVFHGLPCGKPLPERCGPVGRIYLELPSRVGLPPRQPRPEPPPPAPKRPSRSPSAGSVIELDEVEPQVAVANDGEVYLGETPRIGTLSEGAAQAKRLFDKGAWAEAAVALERAATGQYGDDEGNRQLAEYHLAVAHFNLKHYETAADLFLLIMEDPGHHKIGDSWNWLPRLLVRCTTRSVLMGLRRFDDSGSFIVSRLMPEGGPTAGRSFSELVRLPKRESLMKLGPP